MGSKCQTARLTAKRIQRSLYYRHHASCEIVAINAHCFCGENDFVAITKAGYGWEFEIKISRSDFFADFKKVGHTEDLPWHGPLSEFPGHKKYLKHDIYSGVVSVPKVSIPKRFYFVVADGIVKPDEVPEHCGLIVASRETVWNGYGEAAKLTLVRQAPDLAGAGKLDIYERTRLLRSAYFRFWELWCRETNEEIEEQPDDRA